MNNDQFTIQEALAIQAEQLEQWKQVLNRETYLRIENEIEILNAMGYQKADHVVRGQDISNMVYKIMDKYRNDKIEAANKADQAFEAQTLPGEQWMDVPGYGSRYQISNKGRLSNTSVLSSRYIVKPVENKGYHYYTLYQDKGIKNYAAHRLVMLAFKPGSNAPITHINGIRNDNRLENLEYTTRKTISKINAIAEPKNPGVHTIGIDNKTHKIIVGIQGKNHQLEICKNQAEAYTKYKIALQLIDQGETDLQKLRSEVQQRIVTGKITWDLAGEKKFSEGVKNILNKNRGKK